MGHLRRHAARRPGGGAPAILPRLRAYLPAALTAAAGVAMLLAGLSAGFGWALIVFAGGIAGLVAERASASRREPEPARRAR
jgi:hypothetical protein